MKIKSRKQKAESRKQDEARRGRIWTLCLTPSPRPSWERVGQRGSELKNQTPPLPGPLRPRGRGGRKHEYCEPAPARISNPESGMATVLFIALLAIMMVFVMVESQALIRLRREVKLMEQHQIKRLNGPQTNAVATATLP